MLLLDLVMPNLDGYGVLRGLKALGAGDRFPVLIITGESGQEAERTCLLEGATDFIKKPFIPELVRQRVKNATALFEYKNGLEERVAAQTAELRAPDSVWRSYRALWSSCTVPLRARASRERGRHSP